MIETERLVLRPPGPADRAALHAMWADPEVMADLGPIKDAAASDADIARHDGYRVQGLGFWLTERRADGEFLGFCGLKPGEHAPIAGDVEAGWMLARRHWGLGYAQEAMLASFAWCWANRDAPRIVAITSARNAASRGLMAKLGMVHLPDLDFEETAYAPGDARRASVIYALGRPA